jgi:hypothetical protein
VGDLEAPVRSEIGRYQAPGTCGGLFSESNDGCRGLQPSRSGMRAVIVRGRQSPRTAKDLLCRLWNNFRKKPMKISIKRREKLLLRCVSDLGEALNDWPDVGGMIRGVEIRGFWQWK